MKHPFIQSIGNPLICASCKKDATSHTDMAVCECCENVGPVELLYGSILMCQSCEEKEKALQAERVKPENVQARLDSMNAAIEASRAVDNTIQVRTDLFNAATVSIVELKAAIDNDASISNKPYALAEELTKRFTHYKSVVFELNEKIVEAGNQQKAIQIYLNQLANSLRAEEREKLKIADINYQPKSVKPVTPKGIKTTGTKAKTKIDKAELQKYAKELGISDFFLQQIVVQKGVTVEQAANILRKSINEAKSI